MGRVPAALLAGEALEKPALSALRKRIRQELGAAATPQQMLVVDSIPRTGSGKIDRQRAITLFEQG